MSATSRKLESWEREPFADAASAIDDMRRRCEGCPPVRVLSAAVCDALPPEVQAAVSAHIDSCPTCLALRADLEQLAPVDLDPASTERILGKVGRASGAAPAPWWHRWTVWVPASLSATAAILTVVFLATPDRNPARAPAAPSRAQSAAPAADTRTAPPAMPVPALQKPAVKLTMLALTWRSAGRAGAGFAEDIAPALEAFRQDRYADAERLLQGLATRYPNSVEIPFYQGVSLLFLERPDEAVAALRRAQPLADATFAADASWYLGVALSRSGHAADAHATFSALCQGKGPYSPVACEALGKTAR